MRILRLLLGGVGVLFVLGCSNLNSPRFSQGFYEEKRLQLTRKADLFEGNKVALVAFSVYLSDLESRVYPKEEVFLVEVAFEDESIKPDDLSFTLLGRSPTKVKKLTPAEEKTLKAYRHSPWNQLFIVHFDSVLAIDVTNIILKMHIKGREQELSFDYSYVVENVL